MENRALELIYDILTMIDANLWVRDSAIEGVREKLDELATELEIKVAEPVSPLPCPFCGCKEIERWEYEHSYMFTKYHYSCKECNATVWSVESSAEALKKWNTRS